MTKPKISDSRPRIWAEGTQNPPFQPRAFALASVIHARESLSGLLTRCAASAGGFGQLVATGRWRVPENRLGRSGRYLPSVATTAATICGAAEVLRRAALVANPDAGAAPQSIFTPAPPRDAPRREAAQPSMMPPMMAPPLTPARSQPDHTEDADLAAIRAVLDGAAQTPRRPAHPARPVAAQRPTDPATEPRPAPQTLAPVQGGWRRDWLADRAADALGYGLLVVAVPVGAVQALMAHLNGEDLRKLVDQARDRPGPRG